MSIYAGSRFYAVYRAGNLPEVIGTQEKVLKALKEKKDTRGFFAGITLRRQFGTAEIIVKNQDRIMGGPEHK